MPESVAEQVIAERQERAHRGAERCRQAIADVTTERALERVAGEVSVPLSEADLLLERARRRAALERRTRTLTERTTHA